MVATEGGLEDARSAKRIPEGNRWSGDSLSWVKWAPWRRYKDAVDADGDLPEGVPAEDLKRNEDKPGGLVFVNTRESAPESFTLTKRMPISMVTPGDVGDVLVSPGVWAGNLTLMIVGRGLERLCVRMPR